MNWCASVQFPKGNIPVRFQVIKPTKVIVLVNYHHSWLVFVKDSFRAAGFQSPKVEHLASQL